MMELDFQLALLAQLEALSKQLVASTLVPSNFNPVMASQCNLYGEDRTNDHFV